MRKNKSKTNRDAFVDSFKISIGQTEDRYFVMRGRDHTLSVDNKEMIVIADPHLESVSDDVEGMVQFVRTLTPTHHVLIFLGDLFHVWTESKRYRTSRQQRLLDELNTFRERGGAVFLTVGNRDLFFADRSSSSLENGLPFDAISRNCLSFSSSSDIIMAHHGDTVNRNDNAYLLWRRIVRSSWLKFAFRLIPAEKGKKLIYASEKKIKKTNKKFRIYFPEADWSRFVKEYHRLYAPTLLLIGHFHPDRPIISRYGSTTGIVVPSWHMTQTYLVINSQLRYQMKHFF
jgi:UDP-2,3-diacylglucosamine pyrophosphatase LpxH